MDADSFVSQSLGECIVLLFGLRGPHHVVEEQLADVLGGQPGQLQPRSMDDGLAKLADLRLHRERHGRTSVLVAA